MEDKESFKEFTTGLERLKKDTNMDIMAVPFIDPKTGTVKAYVQMVDLTELEKLEKSNG